MRRIAVINQKGGVGKTTTTTNVGAALARAGKRVLMIDLDPQAHLTLHVGIDPGGGGQSGTYELLTDNSAIDEARQQVSENLWVVGSSIDLAAAEVELVSIVGREVILRDLIDQHVVRQEGDQQEKYDYILMDCPPSLSVLTLNGLCAAEEVFIPLQPHYLALQGLSKLLETVSLVGKRINPQLRVGGVMVCMHESGTKLAAEVIDDVKTFLEHSRDSHLPWSQAKVFDAMIRRNIKLAEAPSHGCSIFDYAPESNGAYDYRLLAMEIDDAEAYCTEIARLRAEESARSRGAATDETPEPDDIAPVMDPETTDEPVAESRVASAEATSAAEQSEAPADAPEEVAATYEPVIEPVEEMLEPAQPVQAHQAEPEPTPEMTIKPSAVVRFGGTPLPPAMTTPLSCCTSGFDQRSSLPVLAEPRPFAPIVGPIRLEASGPPPWPTVNPEPAV